MGSGVWGFVGVIVGGLLTVGGQTIAELLKARAAGTERSERRAQLSREFQRSTLIELQVAMAAYRAALAEDARQSLPGRDLEELLAAARSRYQTLLHRVSSSEVRDAVQGWETQALLWFQRDDRASASDEAGAWLSAVRSAGEAIRATE
ncbi:hypothetical protein [Blastococcus brunescens]|uniref:Uncharacterized protein n=1 Tax=Blastococcus brunescens TaxID=1564165 RepID=A0ABZ1AUE6_9ACTN|nr:hypothetical protein [Blastococcus sp. BMG 8361]WRL62203.1 hypothetical protein U6N30_19425 [Blastococcus sp. BMG 8361]